MSTTKAKRSKAQFQATGCWIKPKKRLAIYLRDRFTCLYCLRDMHNAKPQDITLDHIKSRCDGGSHRETNLITACRSCNCSRRDLPLHRFAGPETRKHIRRNIRRNLKPYLVLARAIRKGEMEYDRDLIDKEIGNER